MPMKQWILIIILHKGINIKKSTFRGIGNNSFGTSSAQFCGVARISLMAQFWRSFCLNRAQNWVILAAMHELSEQQNSFGIEMLCHYYTYYRRLKSHLEHSQHNHEQWQIADSLNTQLVHCHQEQVHMSAHLCHCALFCLKGWDEVINVAARHIQHLNANAFLNFSDRPIHISKFFHAFNVYNNKNVYPYWHFLSKHGYLDKILVALMRYCTAPRTQCT